MVEFKSKRMLVILAHPGDESFGMGGTLAKCSHLGVQVVLLCATHGEAGIPGLNPDEAGKVREQELQKAVKLLGIEVYFLHYVDGQLSNAVQANLLESVAGWIDTVQPQVILTFGPDGIPAHSDHAIISHIVTKVVNEFFPRTWLFYFADSEAIASGRGVTSSDVGGDEKLTPVDISDFKIDKARAIQCHASQHPNLEERLDKEVDIIPCHEDFTLGHRGNDVVDWCECVEKSVSQVN